ncbi:GAL4-like transcription factor-like protein [Karstenula rhodostoma CBS 690.94]|uniref:GAL4-like transcription factor-like protein n=1 Tax=Karstenula rhodostoma CBS 690.94 TaxID=1392251 RepID=A0A9P4UFC9_9PLEO|nr:GAL4-like transcription factor-like protein [Karstenula rhodostoma CBS 690.94]
MLNRTKVRRRVLACARCRKRKLSCDGKVPACTRCVDARVECVGFDSSTQKEAPRSIAGFLEAHIATLNNANTHTALRTPGRPSVAFPSPAASHDSDSNPGSSTGKCSRADGLVDLAMQDITPKFLGVTQKRPFLSCVVKGTQLPSRRGPVGSTDLDENHPRSIINPQTNTNYLDSIAWRTASGLFNNYLERVITQYPIYHRNDVTAAFNAVYVPMASPRQATSRDRYIVSIIMAISLSTAARTKQEQANAQASLIVRQAMQYIPDVATNDVPGLQAILLLTQYIFLNPSMADVWLLTGLISQAVIDLGLHQELPNDSTISAYQRDMRRRLFWCAWEMEIGVCCIFQYPFTLPIQPTNVEFPVEVDDTSIKQTGIDYSGRVSKFTSRRICLFRLLEAEITSIMWHEQPLPQDCPSIEHWKQGCMQRIEKWKSEIYEAAAANRDPSFVERWKEMTLYSEITLPYVAVAVYRPTKAVPSPPPDQLLVAFHNTVLVANGYCQQNDADYGRIKYVFHPCHHVFNCATVFLRILSLCPRQISEIYSFEMIEDYTIRFATCFRNIAERWPAARRCLNEYERLLEPVRQGYQDFLAQKAMQTQMSEISAEATPNICFTEQMDDTVNSWSMFNPTAASSMSDPLSATSYNAPYDWHTEFDLDFGRESGAIHDVEPQFAPQPSV